MLGPHASFQNTRTHLEKKGMTNPWHAPYLQATKFCDFGATLNGVSGPLCRWATKKLHGKGLLECSLLGSRLKMLPGHHPPTPLMYLSLKYLSDMGGAQTTEASSSQLGRLTWTQMVRAGPSIRMEAAPGSRRAVAPV